jgi:elongator complex protein 3
LLRERYEASQGIEVFLSAEDVKRDILLGILRLRDPSTRVHRPELARAVVVRELHVYGPLVRVGRKPGHAWQHRGYGKWLLAEAERIAREEFDAKRIAVLSGIGVRDYYRRFGYELLGPYMVKVVD